MTTRILIVAACLVPLGVAGCDATEPASGPENTVPAKTAWLLSESPDAPLTIAEAKAGAKPNETIAVRGRIGGRKDAMTAGSSVFVIISEDQVACDPERCATPWDYCCTPADELAADSATVSLVGPKDGAAPDPAAGGLKPLDTVVVVGTVGPRPDSTVLTIRATGVYAVNE